MDFSLALVYSFRDPQWPRKYLLVGLVSLIPVFGQILVLGWALGIARRAIEHRPDLLPELDLAADLVRGLKAWGISLIYALPAIVVGAPLGLGIGLMTAAMDGRVEAVGLMVSGLCLVGMLIL